MKMRLIDVNDLLRDTCNECRAYYSEAKQSCPCNHGECDAIFTASELNEDVCFMECDSCNDCSFVYEETGICKWKHADEVEEV